MKTLFILFLALGTAAAGNAQAWFTRTGHVWFFSSAPLEDIEAHNRQVTSLLNTATNDLAFSVLIKGFEFKKALMQSHFNENYLESDKWEKATFAGKIADPAKINWNKPGTYKDVPIQGDLTIKDVKKPITSTADIIVGADMIEAVSTFKIKLQDYHVQIPSAVSKNIAEVVDIHVEMQYKKK